jgi:hypothetical protein
MRHASLIHMKPIRFLIALVAAAGWLWAQPEININSKYLVERVEIAGGSKTQISRGLRADMENLVGKNLNQESLERLARRLRRELHARVVSPKVTRGSEAEKVAVLFEVKGRPKNSFDLSLPKGVYNSRLGWSGALEARLNVPAGQLKFGVVSDGEESVERFAGIRAGYEHRRVGTDRVRLGFQFSSFHQQWQPQTLTALAASPQVPGIYRTRQDFAPTLTLVLAEPLTLSAGMSFQRFQKQYPAAHTEAANAVTTTLRYARRIEDANGNKHEVEAGYSLRAATKTIESDYVYSRHELEAGYKYRWGHNEVAAKFQGGRLNGTAPLFERFVLGNSSTLRGWTKWDVAPLGATRAAHASVEYAYHDCRVFYDAGSLWDSGRGAEVKHSLGVGYRAGDGFFLAMAFPVKSGRALPVFSTGVVF